MEKKAANRASHFRDKLVIVVGLLVRKVIEDDGTITITTRVEVASPGQVDRIPAWAPHPNRRLSRLGPRQDYTIIPRRSLTLPALGSFLVHLALGRHRLYDWSTSTREFVGSAAMQDYVKSPGSDGASPYLRWGLFWGLSACTSLYGVIAYTIVDADPGDLWGSAAMQDYVKSPGSDGASPYLRRRRPNTPTRRHAFPKPPAGAG